MYLGRRRKKDILSYTIVYMIGDNNKHDMSIALIQGLKNHHDQYEAARKSP
jgi:hypothetical protein